MAGNVKLLTEYMVVVETVEGDSPHYIGGDGVIHVRLLFATLPRKGNDSPRFGTVLSVIGTARLP